MHIPIVVICLLVCFNDISKFHIWFLLAIYRENRAHNHLIDVPIEKKISRFTNNMFHGIVNGFQIIFIQFKSVTDKMDLECHLMKHALKESFKKLWHGRVANLLTIRKIMYRFYKLELSPHLGWYKTDLDIQEMDFQRCRHCLIEFQEKVTSFP